MTIDCGSRLLPCSSRCYPACSCPVVEAWAYFAESQPSNLAITVYLALAAPPSPVCQEPVPQIALSNFGKLTLGNRARSLQPSGKTPQTPPAGHDKPPKASTEHTRSLDRLNPQKLNGLGAGGQGYARKRRTSPGNKRKCRKSWNKGKDPRETESENSRIGNRLAGPKRL